MSREANPLISVRPQFLTRSDLASKEGCQMFSSELITAVTMASWMPAVALYFIAFCSNKIRMDILKVMDKMDPDAMAKMQLISFGGAVVFSIVSFAVKFKCAKHFEEVNFNAIPVDLFPLSSRLFKGLDAFNSTPATQFLKNLNAPAYIQLPFALLNYAIFVAASLIQNKEAEGDSKFNSIVFRLSLDPAMTVVLNLMIVMMSISVASVLWTAGKGLQKLFCRRSEEERDDYLNIQEGRLSPA